MDGQTDRIRNDIVTDMKDVIGKDDVNFELIIKDEGLTITPIGSLQYCTQYSKGGAQNTVFRNEDLSLDILINHTNYANNSELR